MLKLEEDFKTKDIAKRSAEKVLDSFKGDFSKLPPPIMTKVTVQAAGHFAEYLDAPLLDISRMHKEDNIQAVVSTPRASLILEEESREQLRRAVEFHEMFQQEASFLNTLQLESSKHDTGSIFHILSNFVSYFSLCSASFEKEVAYFSEKAIRKRMEVRLAAMEYFVNPTLRAPFMTSDPFSANIVSPESARETVKAIRDLPDRILEKAFKDPNLHMKAVQRKPTRPSLINIPQKKGPGLSSGYQQQQLFTPQQNKGGAFQGKKGPSPTSRHKSSHQGQSSFQKDRQGGGKQRDNAHSSKKQDKNAPYRRRH